LTQFGDREPLLIFSLSSPSPLASVLTPTMAPLVSAEASMNATSASHMWAPSAFRPSCCNGVICHLVFSQRRSL
jgi:hypothetical protein